MSTNTQYKANEQIRVELTLSGGPSFYAYLFVHNLEGVNDILNDPKKFLPIQDETGQVRLVNKAMIVTVIPSDETRQHHRRFDHGISGANGRAIPIKRGFPQT
jgi:hypothetical protein